MESETYALIKHNFKKLLAVDLDCYKEEQMRRRLDSWLARTGAASWSEYFQRLRAEPAEAARLRNYLTIKVSSFFRDPDRWQTLRRHIIPELLKTSPVLRIWSAGCATGPEAYSLAILLDEITPGRRHTLIATDLDRGALAQAQAGGPFTTPELQNIDAARRVRYFEPGRSAATDQFFVASRLTRSIDFREHDLLADEIEGGFDLIVCRNVIIYFTATVKEKVFHKLHAALRSGGILFIGGTEIILSASRLGLQNFDISFYRKL